MASINDRYIKILIQFREAGQEHVFRFWEKLKSMERQKLLDQAEEIDLGLLCQLKKLIDEKETAVHYKPGTLRPFAVTPLPQIKEQFLERQNAILQGERLLSSGKVGAILVAGGQGTRLGFSGPKGAYPVGPISNRTLFQYHIEKIMALENRHACMIPIYIMTSKGNFNQTVQFFDKNQFFRRDRNSFIFFKQRELPAFDRDGRILLDQKWSISTAPDGHGGLIHALKDNNLLSDMKKRGVEILFYFQVDNVMVRICDPAFLGYHVLADAEMSAKTVRKRDAFEKLGNIGYINNEIHTIEYSELSDDEKNARVTNKLKFEQGSIAIHVFNRSFFERITSRGDELPYHIAFKSINYIGNNGKRHKPRLKNGIKFEQFIFDLFPVARKVMVMETDRLDFSPIKNKSKEDSPKTARRDLSNMFGTWLSQCGVKIRKNKSGKISTPVEISPLFATSAEELKSIIDPLKVKKPYLFESKVIKK
jgi:UDP-N-acetylglucosamine/UDP-N-acetylgalactosamine diphosphorylase